MFCVPEKFRLKALSNASDGNNGVFEVKVINNSDKPPRRSYLLQVIASDGGGWEHASVSLAHRTPTWWEMCHIKAVFWEPEDCVLQYHPPESKYINCHPYCLHLWRPADSSIVIPTPPEWMVGIKL